ncbi:MAG: cytochrome-c peroxidase [Nitrospinae bacterium]|nr:cytochrome-c peroxidase [Nitrospinota bacterium]
MDAARDLFEPLPAAPIFKGVNPANDAKIELGKMLYFETRLSKSNAFSCNSCHNLANGGVDNNPFSIGHQWQVGGRNAPTVFNASLHIAQFWDGRAADVEAQAVGPELNPVEMGSTEKLVMDRLSSIPAYVALFKKAFPEQKKPMVYANVGNAIGAFERTLLTPSPFDAYLKGDDKALSSQAKKGLVLFMDKGCSNCHNGVAVGGNSYQKFGMVNAPKDLKDKGRMEVTKTEEDAFVFKVPSLRNIELTYPYFHDSRTWDLSEAVRIMGWTQLGVKLADAEVGDIVAFLRSLTGTAPVVTLPVLPPSTPATPLPDRN